MGGPRFARLGYWAALTAAGGAVAYGLTSIAVGILTPSTITWNGYEQFAADYRPLPTILIMLPPFLVAVAFPVLVMALTSAGSQERQPLAMLALVFSGIYAAVLGSAYWLQLTYVPWNIIRGAGEEIAPWVAWNPAGFFWAFETFGYFALGAACLFAALALERGMMPHRIRGGLFALAALGVLFLLTAFKDVVFDPTPAADPTGAAGWANAWALSVALAWVITFAFVSGSLARWFAQRSRAARRAADVATRETREASSWQPT